MFPFLYDYECCKESYCYQTPLLGREGTVPNLLSQISNLPKPYLINHFYLISSNQISAIKPHCLYLNSHHDVGREVSLILAAYSLKGYKIAKKECQSFLYRLIKDTGGHLS